MIRGLYANPAAATAPQVPPLRSGISEPVPLSIIVPVVNEVEGLDLLGQRLGRLRSCEIMVVDGGSDDGTAEALRDPCPRRFPGLWAQQRSGHYHFLPSRRGRAAQMNAGALCSQAETLIFLHADTTFSQEHIHAVLHAVDAGADFGCFRLQLSSLDLRLRLVGRLISLRSRLWPSATGDQAIFMRRDLFMRLGGYRDIALCEDLDLISRARRSGSYACLDRAVVTSARRWEQRGVYKTIALMWALRLLCHVGVDPGLLRRIYDDVR